MTTGSNSNDPADDPRPDYVTSRLRYFGGEFLSTQAFVDEQNYHVDRQARHEACLHAPGVLEGLDVTQASSTSVSVSFGSALDADGNQILLSDAHGNSTGDPIEVDLPSNPDDGDYIVDIMFVETRSAPQSGSEGDTRFTQDPDTPDGKGNTMLAIGTSPRPGAVPLARVRVTGEVIDAIDADYFSGSGPTQKYAGVKLPGPSGKEATLRVENVSDDPNSDPDYKVLLSASGGLAVTGTATVSETLAAKSTLDVTGLLTASGGLEVNDDGALTFNNATRQMIILNDGSSSGVSSGIGTQTDTVYFRSDYGFAFYQGGTHDNDKQAPGDGGKRVLAIGNGGNVLLPGMLTIGQGENMDGPSDILEVYDTDTQDDSALFTVGRSKIDASIPLNAHDGLTVAGTATASEYTFPASATQGDTPPMIKARRMPAGQGNDTGSDIERSELILFAGNDSTNVNGPDAITLRARALRLQTYSDASVVGIDDNAGCNDRLYIDSNGKVSIGKCYYPDTANNWLEVWDPDNTGSSDSAMLEVHSDRINTSVVLNANAGLTVHGPSSLFGVWETIDFSNSDYTATTDGFVLAQAAYSSTSTPEIESSGSVTVTVYGSGSEEYTGYAYASFDPDVPTGQTQRGSVTMPVGNGQKFRVQSRKQGGVAPKFHVYWIPLGIDTGTPSINNS